MPDFIPPGLNPLEIPEIIVMVGQQIPLCRRTFLVDPFTRIFTNSTPVTLFAPKDLLACTAVCQAWRRILLPVLWRYYDGPLMRYVPIQVLQKASIYFRVFRDTFGQYHNGPFFSSHLQQLIISQQHEWAIPFMDANPNLQHLTWTGLGSRLADEQFFALTRLGHLRDLCLSNCSLAGLSLVPILTANSGLLRLSLSSVDCIAHLNGMVNMAHLEEIALGYLPVSSQGAVLDELIQYCPSLRRISFLGTWGPTNEYGPDYRGGRDLLKLSSILRLYCPELESIQFAAAYCFGVNQFNTLQDFELAALAESTDRLTSFGAEISSLSRMLTDTLICQTRTLVAVDLCIRHRHPTQNPHNNSNGGVGSAASILGGEGLFELDILDHGMDAFAKQSQWENYNSGSIQDELGQPSDIANAARILTHCSNLRVFRLTSDERWIRMEEAMALFARPWACLGLEVLSLRHITAPASPPLRKKKKTSYKTNNSGCESTSGLRSSSTIETLSLRQKAKAVTEDIICDNSPQSTLTTTLDSKSSIYPSPSLSPPFQPPFTTEPPVVADLVADNNESQHISSMDTEWLSDNNFEQLPIYMDEPTILDLAPSNSNFGFFEAPLQASPSLQSNLSTHISLITPPLTDTTVSSIETLSSRPSSCSMPHSSFSLSSKQSISTSPATSSQLQLATMTEWTRSRPRSGSSCSSTSTISSLSDPCNTVLFSEDEEGEDEWAFGEEFKQRLVPQVTLLTVLREFCLNKVRYARATII